jgi:branched-subunit amino acid aminotransferase/4-amino-4-deoxychorismate lyase
MSRVTYVDRQYVPHRSRAVRIEDRGYQFADGVYEVVAVTVGRVKIDGAPVGSGVPGPVTCRLRELYLAHVAGAP